MREAFSGISVVDATGSIAGNYCAKLLRLHGADVTMVEPVGGSPVRQWGPPGGRADDASPLFRHLNAGKRSVSVDVANDVSRRAARRIAEAADVVLHDERAEAWLDPAPLAERAVVCRITDFPAVSRWEGWSGSEMIHQALSGVMYVTGSPDHQPLYGVGHRAYFAAGVSAYITVTSALLERRSSGRGQRARTTVLESSAAMAQNFVTQYAYNRTYSTRRRYPGMLSILKCRDAWVILFALRHFDGLCETFDVPELLTDPRFVDPVVRGANWHLASDILAAAAARFDADELVDRGQRRKVSIEKVHSMADLLRSEQLRARGMVVQDDGRTSLGPVFRSVVAS
ncbi:CoA transferase [Pseudonocardia humida]|uniref:CoA transferase n=1 Tax=Pseudonocardia humida TaxID=2800819 RepID=A0ABT1A9L3_9PSEU|nr:CoA transferase [Pseudonocardia humida]MCO1659707.1 CoA transferase [Pseudonocardia humida]